MSGSGTLIKGNVIDGTGAAPLPDGTVVVVGERIAWVGRAKEIPTEHRNPAYRVIDLPGRSIVPGLVDGHVHISFGEARSEEELALYTPVEYRAIRAVWNARKLLNAGVTSAFDAASTFNVAVSVRDAIESGMYEGPRFAVCGRQLTTHQGLEDSFPSSMEFPPGQAGVLVRNRDEIVEAVRLQIKDGVDCIKVSGSSDSAISNEPIEGAAFRAEEFDLIADETHRLQRVCTVHARSRQSAFLAAKAGFDWLMHASFIDDAGIEQCLKNRVAITPTLTLLYNIVESADDEAGASAVDVFKFEIEAAAKNLSRAFKAGVSIMAGSESGWSLVPYGDWHARELEILVETLGMTPVQAIHAGTKAAARCLPRWQNEIGSLEVGRFADLIVLPGDPARDIRLLQRKSKFDLVMKAGRSVDLATPIAPRRIWPYEKHRTFLPGWYRFDESTGKGAVSKRGGS